MQYMSVRAVKERMKSRFKIDMDLFDVVSACRDALKKMSCISPQRRVYVAWVNNFCVNLPAVWKVRGVIKLDTVAPFKIDIQEIYHPPQIIFKSEETDSGSKEPTLFKSNYIPQIKGPWVDYVWKCPLLKFNETDMWVAVETTGLALDDEGFPLIPEPAFFGCLFYTLYVYYEPLVLLRQIDPNLFALVTQWKNDNVRQSFSNMMFEALTDNEMDNVFNILTSFDRKVVNVPS